MEVRQAGRGRSDSQQHIFIPSKDHGVATRSQPSLPSDIVAADVDRPFTRKVGDLAAVRFVDLKTLVTEIKRKTN